MLATIAVYKVGTHAEKAHSTYKRKGWGEVNCSGGRTESGGKGGEISENTTSTPNRACTSCRVQHTPTCAMTHSTTTAKDGDHTRCSIQSSSVTAVCALDRPSHSVVHLTQSHSTMEDR